MRPELLFDASEPPELFVTLVLFVAVGLFAMAVIQFRNRKKRPGDSTMIGAHALIIVVVAISLAGLSVFNLWQTQTAKWILESRTPAVLQGCAQDYAKVVHTNDHNVTDMYFTLSGYSFHFNSSPWLPGYHEAGDTIHPGDRLRILAHGERVLRIERLGSACPA